MVRLRMLAFMMVAASCGPVPSAPDADYNRFVGQRCVERGVAEVPSDDAGGFRTVAKCLRWEPCDDCFTEAP